MKYKDIEDFADKKFGCDWNDELTDEHRDEIYDAYEEYLKSLKNTKKRGK